MLSVLLFMSLSEAYVFVGNPKLNVVVDRSESDLVDGTASLDKVRVHQCGGGYTDYEIDAWIDPVNGWGTTIGGGNLCAISLKWHTDVWVESTAFLLRYEELTTTFTLTSSGTGTVSFSPFVVEEGSFSGSTPNFAIWLD